jgi:uncharacterized membrane protein
MSDLSIAELIFTLAGMIFVGLGLPLFLRRVPPNPWYGCRTTRTLSDKKIWYEVNQVTGKGLILTGVLVIISSQVVFIFGRRLNSNYAVIILLAVLVLSTAGMVLNSFRAVKRR